MSEKPVFDLSKINEKLAQWKGPKIWRSLDELLETQEFKDFLAHEYPYEAAKFEQPVSRREFMKLMGASLMMAGLAGCRPQPLEKIVPYRKAPEEMIPGKPLFFATAMPMNGSTVGLLVESHMGRPTKIEGHPEHPDSLGATSAFHQAAILGLYDPERSKVIMNSGRISTWEGMTRTLENALVEQEAKKGQGLRILTETVVSPTLGHQLNQIIEKYPNAKWHQYGIVNSSLARKAQMIAFDKYVDPLYDLTSADVILSLNSNLFQNLSAGLRYARQFAKRRLPNAGTSNLNRLYAIETTLTPTGAAADHRLAVNSEILFALAWEIAKNLGVKVNLPRPMHPLPETYHAFVTAVTKDLKKHAGRSLIVSGDDQPPALQALAYAMNEALGNAGKTIFFIEPVEAKVVDQDESLKDLKRDLDQGLVDILIILGGNPVYHAPDDLQLNVSMRRSSLTIRLSQYEDETSAISHWHIPQLHFLEHFSDGKASDGTLTTIQPLIEPLYGGKSEHDLASLLLGKITQSSEDAVKEYWQTVLGPVEFEKKWRKVLHDGFVSGSGSSLLPLKAKTSLKLMPQDLPVQREDKAFELVIQPDPAVFDGRFSNNSWLQELPKPFSKLTWENTVWISPKDAQHHGLTSGDIIQINAKEKSLKVPVWIQPGQAAGVLTLFMGYGRKFKGDVGTGIGYSVQPLRSSATPYSGTGTFVKTNEKIRLATTQKHHSMEGRNLVRQTSVDTYAKHPDFAKDHHHGGPADFYPEHPYNSYAWGMAINLNACIGCNACVIACQSENNIPVVGKDEVLMGREMHWIRIDQYYEGSTEDPNLHQQPVMCMHCEKAPCEPVCPVGATVHSDEGLNEMVYNRCVGTRYCSNNCPYKVRRFNFLEYSDKSIESLALMRNPDVTVRARGVMEKCTFCVQRINSARIDAEKEKRSIRDGEIVTACQASCPTQAIQFGDISDPNSKVSKDKALPLNYGLLTELNTQPRLTYLAKVTNPNPELAEITDHG